MSLELSKEQREGCYGVRLTYRGHASNRVMTCVYRSTRANLEACITALAALEGVTHDEMRAMLERDADCVTLETYRTYGAA